MTEENKNQEEENTQEEEVVEEKEEKKETKGSSKKTTSGLDQNVAALLSYLLGILGGIIFFVIEKDNKFVKFHAMQSILFSLAASVLWFVLMPFIVGMAIAGLGFIATILPLISLGVFIVWIMLMVKAYNNEEWELPVLGKIARNISSK